MDESEGRMKRLFKFVDPENGRQIRAEWTNPGDFTITRLSQGICGKRKHNMVAVLCVTQWGIDRQRDIAVYQCKRCKRMWAFKIVTFDLSETEGENGL